MSKSSKLLWMRSCRIQYSFTRTNLVLLQDLPLKGEGSHPIPKDFFMCQFHIKWPTFIVKTRLRSPKSSWLFPIQRCEWKSDRWSFLFAQFMHRGIDFNLLPCANGFSKIYTFFTFSGGKQAIILNFLPLVKDIFVKPFKHSISHVNCA